MNILVQGAGALGAYFGGRLLEAGLSRIISIMGNEKGSSNRRSFYTDY